MNDSPFDRLSELCGRDWSAIKSARSKTDALLQDINKLRLPAAENTSLILFGSAGRGELTSRSDLDWSLLVDGPADPGHGPLVGELRSKLRPLARQAGETFGTIISSHELIHRIGGARETNANFTVRMLLLLEAHCVTNSIVRDRVVRGILERYVNVSASIAWKRHPSHLVPRFLLNDFVRYWRTIAVDYAAKRWEQYDEKWGLRNAKLRLSRKLLFVTGLLMCFRLELEKPDARAEITGDAEHFGARYAGLLLEQARQRPLDVLSDALLRFPPYVAVRILDPYDQFLALIDNEKARDHLEKLPFDQAMTSDVFAKVRAIGHEFQNGLNYLFFEADKKLTNLILEYGVF